VNASAVFSCIRNPLPPNWFGCPPAYIWGVGFFFEGGQPPSMVGMAMCDQNVANITRLAADSLHRFDYLRGVFREARVNQG
jgi:hypothetical protein